MKYVLDSSVAFKWLVPEVDTDKALRIRDAFNQNHFELIAPDILAVEVTHALTRAERQGRLTPAQGVVLLTDLLKNLPQLHNYLPLLPRAYEVSSTMRIGVYDCLYLALAEQESCEFITADVKLTNLKAQFPFLTPLSSMP
ncbi:MAG TPA: type II toxin-antitoxin system VapC family toxin [Gemmataceae bacterium]|nr:type II toxin-antitoxin system VapC family toxin [Gemmataceae bacterium]